MVNLNRDQIFNLVFIFVTTVALGMLLGLSVLRTVDQRLSDVTIKIPEIKIPEIKIPEPNVRVELPESYFEKVKRKPKNDKAILHQVNDYPNLNLNSDDNVPQKGGANRQRSGTDTVQSNNQIASCYRDNIDIIGDSDCGSGSGSGSGSLRYNGPNPADEYPNPLDHPDFVSKSLNPGAEDRAQCREKMLSRSRQQSASASEIWPRHPKNADHDPIAHLPPESHKVNSPKTHQWVSNNAAHPMKVSGEWVTGQYQDTAEGQTGRSGQYFDKPWPGLKGSPVPVQGLTPTHSGLKSQHYKAPCDMTDRQRVKFMLMAKFDKMTTVDYRNWLLLYSDSKGDLAPYHRQMLNLVLNGYELTQDDLPLDKHQPLGVQKLFEERVAV